LVADGSGCAGRRAGWNCRASGSRAISRIFPSAYRVPELRDYLGLPINDSARQFADSWDPSRITLPEEQCRVHVSPYILRGPTNLRILVEKDPKTQDVIAVKMYTSYLRADADDLDGRAPRIRAPTPRTPGWDSSTGRWDGDMS
jgi:hypothetical protein